MDIELEKLKQRWITEMIKLNPREIKKDQKSPTVYIANWKIAPEHQRKYRSIVFNWEGDPNNEPRLAGSFYSSPSDYRKRWSYRAKLDPEHFIDFYNSVLNSKNEKEIVLEYESENDSKNKEFKKNILEKDMEDAIVRNPERYLKESGLKLFKRQLHVGNYIFDLVFIDRLGAKLIVEIQRGTLDRNHTYKILDYYNEFKSQHTHDFIELLVIANNISVERKQRLSDMGVSYLEIPLKEFEE